MRMRSGNPLLGVLWAAFGLQLCGCQLERLDPDAVAEGVAQLTARDVALLTLAVNGDTDCGFSSAAVLASPQVNGDAGYPGSVTWTVRQCALDFGESTLLATDCLGGTTTVGGKVVVDATRTVVGTLTGNAGNPVVPLEATAARIEARAEPAGFWARRSGSAYRIVWGTPLSWVAEPKLALSASLGVCAVPTNELTLSAVRVAPATITMDVGDRTFPVELAEVDLSAQLGKWGSRENTLEGRLKVWGHAVTLPVKSHRPVLDPDYDAAAFVGAYSCTSDLAQPVSFTCPPLNELLAQGAARLLVRNAGSLTSALNADKHCGFSSPARLLLPSRVEGTNGSLGLMAWTVKGCELTFPVPTVISESCAGEKTFATGSAKVDAERVVTGLLEKTYFGVQSISPRARDAVAIRLTNVGLEGFVATTLAAGATVPLGTLTVTSGRMSGTVVPYLGERASAAGVFDVGTPVAAFRDLRLLGAKATLRSGGDTYTLDLPDVQVTAQNGSYLGLANTLSGVMTLNGTTVHLDALALDPGFEQAAFDRSYACTKDLREVIPAR
jgi:hypothetical protein